ncbi:BglII/BstYI family type II restriction endonuclease [Geomicrobium sp. JCM 19055]|uniref:BglII/BstYI family type II restriction endonuclease n=1 Tax=Geomicrobium sp. JCM 19055 TaxID=1460649 RepID=UPI00045EDBD5|nr:BglII/BstYI family type II restriction endonuclease [Geomicrobium sp. JCM 19055]GAJ99585.1 hypothetical protein JCM19055_2594 [Geomicrobium sp. JCM 19055]
MSTSLLPDFINENYEVHEWRHACAILQSDFPNEFENLTSLLTSFRLLKSDILTAGGRKSPISANIDTYLYERGWIEKSFETSIIIDTVSLDSPTHKIDCFKNGIALEIEWNNKDPFFDRDLNNFRLLHELRAISVGIIITRATHLQDIFNKLGKKNSYGSSTTHMDKLVPRVQGGGGGGCPILAFGIKDSLYVEDI